MLQSNKKIFNLTKDSILLMKYVFVDDGIDFKKVFSEASLFFEEGENTLNEGGFSGERKNLILGRIDRKN